MSEIPASGDDVSVNPVRAGLAEAVQTGTVENPVPVLACTRCGVLLWDVVKHWRDAHRLVDIRQVSPPVG